MINIFINISKKVWESFKSFTEPISKAIFSVINFFLLLIVYLVGIGIVSLSMKIFGKHFLELKKQNKSSNWHEHKLTKQPIEKYYRTF